MIWTSSTGFKILQKHHQQSPKTAAQNSLKNDHKKQWNGEISDWAEEQVKH